MACGGKPTHESGGKKNDPCFYNFAIFKALFFSRNLGMPIQSAKIQIIDKPSAKPVSLFFAAPD